MRMSKVHFDENQVCAVLRGAIEWARETGDSATIYFDCEEQKFYWAASTEGSTPQSVKAYTISADEAEDHEINHELVELVIENVKFKLDEF